MEELLGNLLILIILGSLLFFSVNGVINLCDTEVEKQFAYNCHFYSGSVVKDSYGNLYCMQEAYVTKPI